MTNEELTRRLAAVEAERDEARRQRDEGGHAECPHKKARMAAEARLATLTGERDEWRQAAETEASLRRDAVAALARAREVLAFYADPKTYHAVMFVIDPPDGGWSSDFGVEHGHPDYDRAMPGKRARCALKAALEG